MHYIFLISFGTIKIFKFQSYYSYSYFLKEIIMITKTYYIITIDVTQIINSILNPNLYFAILKQVHQIGPKRSEIDQMDRVDLSRPNGLNRPKSTKLDRIDLSELYEPNWTEQIEFD